MRPKRHLFFIFLFLFFGLYMVQTFNVQAQEKKSRWFVENPKPFVVNWDTNYYVSYSEYLTTRLYASTKYTGFRLGNTSEMQNLLYLNNKILILGAGATYSWFTLNIGLAFNFANNGRSQYGPSAHLDFQSHVYLRKINIDVYLQLYDGYYLANSANVIEDWPQGDTFQIRPDIYSFTIGYNVQYVWNYKKFSFKAVYNQNEWQKKSAGSWVLGTNAFYYFNQGDSSFVPKNLVNPDLFNGLSFNRVDALNIGISGGYYYTLVLKKHFFVSAGLAAGPSVGFSLIDAEDVSKVNIKDVTLNINTMARASLGYNSEKIFVGFSFLQQMFFNQVPSPSIWSYFNTGNARVYFVYRFKLKKPIKIANPRYWKISNREKKKK